MAIFSLRPRVVEPEGPERPSTFGETVGERTVDPVPDYPSGEQGDFQPDVEFGHPEPVNEPVGVFVTSPIPADLPMAEWSAGTLGASTAPSQIGGGDRNRTMFRIRNLSATENILVSRLPTDLPFACYTLPPGGSEEFTHNSPVWVRTEEGTVGEVPVTFTSEFTLPEVGDGS